MIGLAVMLAAAGPGWETGNSLLSDCQSDNPAKQAFCLGYVGAIGDWTQSDPRLGSRVCLPAGGVRSQMVDVVVKYLKDNPAERAKGASLLVVLALREAFPCPQT
ncbi:MAG: Rap1a/Tai family immunity protein [Sphingomonas sp.]